jgi:hypothetical protein
MKDVELKYSQADNPYWVQKNSDGSVALVRNVIVGIRPLDQN